ncbi:hypothetical protein AS156_23505 [Bradyrhizobium macuxiense]|uniref:Uncharacterized protein n=1 Tax=Bradyrhizobium macuxiense TaxID=1755647 RepID=A0A109JB39_9BRAD|nr:DUF892 family protein [Bradyrhizobium macuxiense]KWV45627.1 hypothetical protein AS156_23505 [Bradyrhizobium macuxiense]
MKITTFKDMYIAELQELASVESQLSAALPSMAEVASHPSLKDAFNRHARETIVQGERLKSLLRMHGADPGLHTDQAMQALIGETAKMVPLVLNDDLRDGALIASAQKLEHYEIAAYGSAAALAGQLELRNDQRLLHDSLEEERHVDTLLTMLAKGEINQDALAA